MIDDKPTQAFSCEGSYLRAGDIELFSAPGTMLAREFAVDPQGHVEARITNPRKP